MGPDREINWFPGHMAKARRNIKDDICAVDALVEVLDARIPVSSKNTDIDDLIRNKPVLVVLNKSDLADPQRTKEWVEYFSKQGIESMAVSCKSGGDLQSITKKIVHITSDKLNKWRSKGAVGKKLKVMIFGEPNTGKSSIINSLVKKNKVKTENRPGVTRGIQLIPIDDKIDLLDTPGILPQKIYGKSSQYNLAITGAIKDEIFDAEEAALNLIGFLVKNSKANLKARYNLDDKDLNLLNEYDILRLIGKNRKILIKGGDVDTLSTSKIILSEFRAGKIGRITLEKVSDFL